MCALLMGAAMAGEVPVEDNRKVVINSYKWQGDSPKAKLVRVINPYGSVSSRTTKMANVELSGVIQEIGDNPPQHQIEVKDVDGVTEVVVSYPQGAIRNAKGQLTGRFDLGVWVPSWVALEVETDFGDIKVKKSASDVTAKSTSGKISIGTSGHVQAHSQSGNVSVDFYGKTFRQGMKVSSQSGNVKVNMSKDARLVLTAKAGSKINNNFNEHQSVSVKQFGDELQARLTSDVTQKIKPVFLHLDAQQGNLSINIANDATYKVDKTPMMYSVNESNKKSKTNSVKDNQSSVTPKAPLAAAVK